MLGEACHFIDTLQALTGAPAVRIYGARTRGPADPDVIATIDFADGSVGSLIYTVAGDRGLAKERIEVAGSGISAVIDDFSVTDIYAQGRRRRFKSRGRDKGFAAEIEHFAATVLNPVLAETQFYNAVASTRATLRLVASLTTREPIDLE
jgi:predicted dehydrogenase